MKRFVGREFVVSTIGGLVTVVIVSLTHAGAAATHLILFGMLAIVIWVELGDEDPETEADNQANAGRAAKGRSGEGRSTGSR